MTPASTTPRVVKAPARPIAASATLATQLLGTLVFALAFYWVFRHRGYWPTNVAILSVGAIGVFAGGNAHRGSVRALVVAALFDVAVVIACFAKFSAVKAFVVAPVAWAAPKLVPFLPTITISAGILAVFAAAACVAAVPQTLRFAAWRYEQLLQAVRTWGGATPR